MTGALAILCLVSIQLINKWQSRTVEIPGMTIITPTALESEAPTTQLTAPSVPADAMAQPFIVSPGKDLRLTRTWHTATRLTDGRIMLIGGCNGGNESYALVEIYDPLSGVFDQIPPLHTPRHEHTATLLPNGKVLVAGGSSGAPVASVELFNPADGTWSATGSLSEARYNHTATLLLDGRVLVAGGSGSAGTAFPSRAGM